MTPDVADLPLFASAERKKAAKPVRVPLAAVQRFQFDGRTFDSDLDGKRLCEQQIRVMVAMSDQRWRSLQELQRLILVTTGKRDGEAPISTRLRDIRKICGSKQAMESRRRTEDGVDGLWEYRSNVVLGSGE